MCVGKHIIASVCSHLPLLHLPPAGAGRVGSAFAAELGTMAVSEQTDSLRVLGSDPVDYLVTPRVLACMIAAPILNLMCFAMGGQLPWAACSSVSGQHTRRAWPCGVTSPMWTGLPAPEHELALVCHSDWASRLCLSGWPLPGAQALHAAACWRRVSTM